MYKYDLSSPVKCGAGKANYQYVIISKRMFFFADAAKKRSENFCLLSPRLSLSGVAAKLQNSGKLLRPEIEPNVPSSFFFAFFQRLDGCGLS